MASMRASIVVESPWPILVVEVGSQARVGHVAARPVLMIGGLIVK